MSLMHSVAPSPASKLPFASMLSRLLHAAPGLTPTTGGLRGDTPPPPPSRGEASLASVLAPPVHATSTLELEAAESAFPHALQPLEEPAGEARPAEWGIGAGSPGHWVVPRAMTTGVTALAGSSEVNYRDCRVLRAEVVASSEQMLPRQRRPRFDASSGKQRICVGCIILLRKAGGASTRGGFPSTLGHARGKRTHVPRCRTAAKSLEIRDGECRRGMGDTEEVQRRRSAE
ncbi:hypothetical protein DFH08DRAFT_956800 [Mycena albidolilacea]|uniref:Uncharacterized protein n=1 Tax=Mycena albidolilacea TaxID=1033008 RepID=A0AAD7A8B7_9AGAR|nr:hypothetical protein DFH08DRAFT_956800 [Mycena albidolilacea]